MDQHSEKVYSVCIVLNDLPIELRFVNFNIALLQLSNPSKEQNERRWSWLLFSTKTTSTHSKIREREPRKDTLLPVLDDLNEITKKGNFIAIGGEFHSFRAFVSCVPLDTVQIPNLLRTKGDKSPYHCPVCLFVGASGGVDHFCRWSQRCSPLVNIFDRAAYKSHLTGRTLQQAPWALCVCGEATFYFPTQTITVDVLHTLAVGLFEQWPELIRSQYLTLFEEMVALSETIKLPRTETYYNTDMNYLNSWKARHFLFFGFVTGHKRILFQLGDSISSYLSTIS